MPFEQTRRWTPSELEADAKTARSVFRDHRISETLDAYQSHYSKAEARFRALLPRLTDIAYSRISYEDLSTLLKEKDSFQAFRYLGGPPVSDDDLETVSGAKKSTTLWSKPADVEMVREAMAKAIDPVRFPWVAEDRKPTVDEMNAAILASGILVAQQKVGTSRRNDAKCVQEAAVMAVLEAEGFVRVARRPINLLADAPAPGEFCPESDLGGTRGDIIITLRDRRLMPIECKASNSGVNSFKRLIHEALGKAVKWTSAFGHNQVVPAAVLSGVYAVGNLETAQQSGLTLYWQNRLSDLAEFVRRAR